MKLIKRCWGCGKRILPWQSTVHTKLAGDIHKGCAFMAARNYNFAKEGDKLNQRLEEGALKQLNEGKTK